LNIQKYSDPICAGNPEGYVMDFNRKALIVMAWMALAVGIAAAQKIKPWTQWTANDAEKILNDSGWGQTQSDVDTTETVWSTASRPIEGIGAVNQATGVNFRIRFLSAKPIRQAFLRLAELNRSQSVQQQLEQMRQFVDAKYDKTIVIAVDFDGKDGRFTQPVFQAFTSAITAMLKNNTYLDVKGGKRVFLEEYQPLTPGEGLGSKFIFPRMIDDQPIITEKTGDVRFYAEFPKLAGNNRQVKLDMRFKVSGFKYEGVIEF
jgi:hypothetical protein